LTPRPVSLFDAPSRETEQVLLSVSREVIVPNRKVGIHFCQPGFMARL